MFYLNNLGEISFLYYTYFILFINSHLIIFPLINFLLFKNQKFLLILKVNFDPIPIPILLFTYIYPSDPNISINFFEIKRPNPIPFLFKSLKLKV